MQLELKRFCGNGKFAVELFGVGPRDGPEVVELADVPPLAEPAWVLDELVPPLADLPPRVALVPPLPVTLLLAFVPPVFVFEDFFEAEVPPAFSPPSVSLKLAPPCTESAPPFSRGVCCVSGSRVVQPHAVATTPKPRQQMTPIDFFRMAFLGPIAAEIAFECTRREIDAIGL